MKVLAVNKFFRRGAGAEAVFLDTITLLEANGHDVAPFAMSHEDNEATPWSPYFVRRRDYNNGHLATRVRDGLASVYSVAARRDLRALLRVFAPDVAHVHNVYHQLTMSVIDELSAAGIPIVMTAHDYKPVCPNYKLLTHGTLCTRCVGASTWHAVHHRCIKDSRAASAIAALEASVSRWRRAYHKIDRIISPSAFLRDVLVDGGFASAQVDVIPNPVRTTASWTRTHPSAATQPSFVYAGRLAEEKGLDVLLSALERVRSAVRVSIYGDGPERDRLELYARRHDLPVSFHGLVSSDDLSAAFRLTRAAILPSTWFENCPVSILEAAAMRVPTVASRIGGIPELIDDGATGLLFPAGDADALAESIDLLVADPDLAVTLGDAAYDRVTERHSEAHYLDAVLASYEKAGACVARRSLVER